MSVSKENRIKELLNVGRMYGENSHPGNYLNGLFDFIQNHIPEEYVICEVGSFRGISSELFALHVKKL